MFTLDIFQKEESRIQDSKMEKPEVIKIFFRFRLRN